MHLKHTLAPFVACGILSALVALSGACNLNSFSSGTQIGDAASAVDPPSALPPSAGATPVATTSSNAPVVPKTQEGWSGIIGQGQSLSVGFFGTLTADTLPAPGGLRLADDANTFDIGDPNNPNLRLTELTEPFRPMPANVQTAAYPYPANIAGQTPHSAMASTITQLAQSAGYASFTTVHSAVGIGGQPMSAITKGGSLNSYAASLYEARALTRLAQAQNERLHYDAVVLTHGEADAAASNTHYGADLAALQAAYAQDLPSITGQADANIVLILSQEQSYPTGDYPTSAVIEAQWRASVDNPRSIVCAMPKYQFGYAQDAVHMPPAGYDRMGDKYAQVFWQAVVQHTPFVPLSPNAVVRTGQNELAIHFNVPVPPLNWDTLLPYAHQTTHAAWAQGQGFEVTDPNGQDVTIDDVAIDAGAMSVTLRLVGAPASALTLSYAMTADAQPYQGGLAGGRIGHLRDSDPFVGPGAEELDCQTTAGSPNIVCPAGLGRRALYDVVQPFGAAVVGLDAQDVTRAVLSPPWPTTTGTQALSFRHEHRNYLVSFTWAVGPV